MNVPCWRASDVEIVNGAAKSHSTQNHNDQRSDNFIYWCHHQSRHPHKNSRSKKQKKRIVGFESKGDIRQTNRAWLWPWQRGYGWLTHGHALRSLTQSINDIVAPLFFSICVYTRMVVGFHALVSKKTGSQSCSRSREYGTNKSASALSFKTIPEELLALRVHTQMPCDGGGSINIIPVQPGRRCANRRNTIRPRTAATEVLKENKQKTGKNI